MVSMKKVITNDHERPPIPVIENSLAKINWNIKFHMEKKPEKNANKVDKKRARLLIEGAAVCDIGLIPDRWKTKQDQASKINTES